MKIGNIKIKEKTVLAPMAGISNPAYIKIIEEMGAGLAYTELISAEAIIRKNKKTFDMLKGIETLKIPVGVQIFGANATSMAKAAQIISNLYSNVFIDINMGCPVPKVAIKNQAGSALLKNPQKIYDLVSSVVKSVKVPVTVKIRSGWDENSINACEVAKIIEEAGASAITIHPRTRSQGYSGKADWSIIKKVKQSVSIPVIGNGDIKKADDAQKMLNETGCDLVMIGRGLLGNPWLIKEINSYINNKEVLEKPSYEEKIKMCLKHFNYLLDYCSEKQAVLEIRTHLSHYLKGINKSKEIKNEIYKTKSAKEIKQILNNLLNEETI